VDDMGLECYFNPEALPVFSFFALCPAASHYPHIVALPWKLKIIMAAMLSL
jgi:hypothetical protein